MHHPFTRNHRRTEPRSHSPVCGIAPGLGRGALVVGDRLNAAGRSPVSNTRSRSRSGRIQRASTKRGRNSKRRLARVAAQFNGQLRRGRIAPRAPPTQSREAQRVAFRSAARRRASRRWRPPARILRDRIAYYQARTSRVLGESFMTAPPTPCSNTTGLFRFGRGPQASELPSFFARMK